MCSLFAQIFVAFMYVLRVTFLSLFGFLTNWNVEKLERLYQAIEERDSILTSQNPFLRTCSKRITRFNYY